METVSGQYNKGFAIVVARSLDVMLCTWAWRDADITISSMCGLNRRLPRDQWKWFGIYIGGFLEWLQPGHCEGAIASDRLRAKQALAILGDPCSIHS